MRSPGQLSGNNATADRVEEGVVSCEPEQRNAAISVVSSAHDICMACQLLRTLSQQGPLSAPVEEGVQPFWLQQLRQRLVKLPAGASGTLEMVALHLMHLP